MKVLTVRIGPLAFCLSAATVAELCRSERQAADSRKLSSPRPARRGRRSPVSKTAGTRKEAR